SYTEKFQLKHPDRFYIDGEWVEPMGSQRFDIVYPATEVVIGSCPAASVVDVDRAVAAARTAFDDGSWPRMSYDERADILERAGQIMVRRAQEFSECWTLEMGCAVSLSGPGGFAPGSIFGYYANMIKGRT